MGECLLDFACVEGLPLDPKGTCRAATHGLDLRLTRVALLQPN